MIVRFRDGGTRIIVQEDHAPGLDKFHWTQPTLWEDYSLDLTREDQNDEMMDVRSVPVKAWPESMPSHMWIDLTDRYERAGDEGIALHMKLYDPWVGFPELTSNYYTPAASIDPEVDFDERDVAGSVDWRTTRKTWWDQGKRPGFVRLDTENEVGGTRLGREWVLKTTGIRNQRVTFVLDDNSMFVPFDLTKGTEWYEVRGSNMELLSEARQKTLFQFLGNSAVTLHLRPRRIRYIARALARYVMATPFESAENDEYFITVGWMRLPVYPVRHDIKNTAGNQDVYHQWFSTWMAVDNGIRDWWIRSKAISRMSHDMVQQQYYTLCTAYILLFSSDTMITLEAEPPEVGDIVLAVEVYDTSLDDSGGAYFIIQKKDVSSYYPKRVLGVFYGDPAT